MGPLSRIGTPRIILKTITLRLSTSALGSWAEMVLLKTQLQFLQVESSACATYLHIARMTHSSEHRQQALANAAAAYAAVKGHMADVALSQEDDATLKRWVEKTEQELRSLLGA